MENQPRNKLTKSSRDEELDKIEIKNKEKFYFDNVFNYLCDLQEEPSSDENSKEKIYQKRIAQNVEKKKSNYSRTNNFKPKTFSKGGANKEVKTKKKYQEDIQNEEIIDNEERNNELAALNAPQDEEAKKKKRKFGIKALRKIVRKLTGSFNKEELTLMIWEVDTNLDGYVSFEEYEKMYKRCITDSKEREPKKLYNLILFLMFDKEQKNYITIEDTLEILCVRNTNGIDAAINDIFNKEIKDEKGKVKQTGQKNETLTFQEFSERMLSLSLRKRTILMNKKKIFCENLTNEAIAGKK